MNDLSLDEKVLIRVCIANRLQYLSSNNVTGIFDKDIEIYSQLYIKLGGYLNDSKM